MSTMVLFWGDFIRTVCMFNGPFLHSHVGVGYDGSPALDLPHTAVLLIATQTALKTEK